MTPRVIAYTAVFGNYDLIRAPKVPGHFVCFTDGAVPEMETVPWKVQVEPGIPGDPIRSARYRKLMAHLLEAEYSVYFDANIELLVSPDELVDRYLQHADIALHWHPQRDCIYKEASICADLNRAPADVLAAQQAHYRGAGYPARNGLYETGVLIRRHTAAIAELETLWWAEVAAFSTRDQVSLPYVLSQAPPVELAIIPGNVHANRGSEFRYHPHTPIAALT